MTIPPEHARELANFPAVLRELVEAELAAGNSIVEISSGFPAPPVGACLKLARNITTKPRESAGGLDFYERKMPDYLSEITDLKRHFFVLEPPGPPEPEPNMDAIRAEREARYAASMAGLINSSSAPAERLHSAPATPSTLTNSQDAAVARFRESMEINYERWHDGTGYDLATLAQATPDERSEIESILTNASPRDWRDVQALAALDTPKARQRLREALHSGDHRLVMEVLSEAPDMVSDAERTAAIVAALGASAIYEGLTQTLEMAEKFHPPEVIAALLRGARSGPGENAVHFVALLLFLHGKAETVFDWELRPFFLRFNTPNLAARETAFHELCEKIGLTPDAP